ncbi:acylneuraminate cytidylyltransferase family protein [uncultured Thalassospira sp.]|uniref:acylneuraminate cytidylyltransferase family protein n=1 Tax=uncultured Thalassospira sp. TaxID=404382 RepID=UPI0032B29191|tara:strand:- start:7430 stop:8131 length:702 start_codon:yes stop_codon:yes gene_type:complete
MYRNARILSVVPARGGSKGIKLKNLREVGGVPLVGLAGDISVHVPEIDKSVVSTDHDEIARVAQLHGLSAPFRRPEHLSGDRIADLDVLTNALLEMESLDGVGYDYVVMLQPTSPLRTVENVSSAIQMCIDGGYDAVWTVSETDSKAHPLKQLTIKDNKLGYFDPKGAQIVARQELGKLYHRNGVAYVISRSCLIDQKSIMGEKTGALLIDGPLISIDTEWDLALTNFIHSAK